MHDATHASWFSGVGGLDLGLERAGWRTVSFSEIDPYASAVLAERWPGVPNLGDIVSVSANEREPRSADGRVESVAQGREWHRAVLWTGGFPCQDLSVAGKRAGFAGERSSLAFAFLDLVERYRPPAILLENVPGLLSSHRGRDMATLVGRMVELGYGVAYRVLDARHFGVPQRRRRVFIVGLRSGPDDPTGRVAAERAAAVLAVGTRCPRHPAAGGEAGAGVADGAPASPDGIVGQALSAKWSKQAGGPAGDEFHNLIANGLRASDGHHGYSSPRGDGGDNLILSPAPDPGGVRATDGLAGRLDDRELARPLLSNVSGGQRTTDLNVPLVYGVSENQRAEVLLTEQAHQLTGGGGKPGQGYPAVLGASGMTADDPLLPLGLDSHRYRCCGNGVVANVAEWLGLRLLAALEAA